MMISLQRYSAIICLLTVAACTQAPAPVEYRGSYFYGQDGAIGNNGMERPKYSDSNRATLPPKQEDKYISPVHDYGVAAEVGGVSASDLPPPAILQPTPPPPQTPPVADTWNATTPPAQDYNAPLKQDSINGTSQQSAAPVAALSQASAYDPNVKSPVDYYAQESSEAVPPSPAAAPHFIWPVQGEVVKTFSKASPTMAIRAMKGDPVRASEDGRVTHVSNQNGVGLMVTVEHAGGWSTSYSQLGDTVVKANDAVVRGQLVGFVGPAKAGSSQLGFAINKGGVAVDPKPLLVQD